MLDIPCIAFALRQERGPFSKQFRPSPPFSDAPCWASICRSGSQSVFALETGVGQTQAERALSWVLSRPVLVDAPYKPLAVIAAGYCGALREELRTGDLVLPTAVLDVATGKRWETTWANRKPAELKQTTLNHGVMATVPRLAASVSEKQKLASETAAIAVDMESATIARLCHQAAVPFACLRVVVDESATPLSPQLVSLLSAGRVSPTRVVASVASSPRLALELWDLARRSRLAARSLATGLHELLDSAHK